MGRTLLLTTMVLLLCLFAGRAGYAQPAACGQPADDRAGGSRSIVEAIGVAGELGRLKSLQQQGQGETNAALFLRSRILERLMLASFDVDETLARIDAEAAHVSDSRSVLEAEKEHRETILNLATFAVGGALGTAGSAMQLTRTLNHAGNALNLAGGATALSLSVVQLRVHGDKRMLRSPYNMLAEVLGQTPNAQSRYPGVVEAYLNSPSAGDGELPDDQAPEVSLRAAWVRLHRLQSGSSHQGASVASVTTDPTGGQRLTAAELSEREAMLRDLHGAMALLKTELRGVLLSLD